MKKMMNWIIVGVLAVVGITMILNRGEISKFLEDRLKEKIYQESGIAEDIEKNSDKIELGMRLMDLNENEYQEVIERYIEAMDYLEDTGYDTESEEVQIMALNLVLE